MVRRLRRFANWFIARAVLGLPRGQSSTGPVRRFGWVVLGLAVLYAGLAVRLVKIQGVDHSKLSALADGQHRTRVSRLHRRGGIFDRNGAPLVISYAGWDLCVRIDDPPHRSLPARTRRAAILARALDRPARDLLTRMERARKCGEKWLRVARGLENPGIRDLALKNVSWMSLTPSTVRKQPRFPLANGLLGRFGTRIACGEQARSLTGLEESLNPILSGVDAEVAGTRDGRGHPLALGRDKQVIKRGRAGADVYLTLDSEVQEVTERVLDQIMTERCPVPGAGGVVLDATTGEILALASRPTCTNPSQWPYQGDGRLDSIPWVLPLTLAQPPGSTFKPFTVGEALSGPNPTRTTDLLDCGHPAGTRGKVRVGARFVGNYKQKRFGSVTVEEALYRSLNVGMARLGDAMGIQRMIGLFRRLGFRRDPEGRFSLRISEAWRLMGRRPGSISHPSRWRRGVSNISWSFGQEMRLTLVDLASAYTAIATDGRIRPPTLIKKVVYPGNRVRAGRAITGRIAKRSRLFSAATAARLRRALNKVVESEGGTLNRLYRTSPEAFGGHAMAGKTGTATVETDSVKRALAGKTWTGHSENILSLVLLGPIGSGPARYVVALTAPHPRAKDKRFISSGRVLGRFGVQIMRYLLDRDRLAGSARGRISGWTRKSAIGSVGPTSRVRGARARENQTQSTRTGIGSRTFW